MIEIKTFSSSTVTPAVSGKANYGNQYANDKNGSDVGGIKRPHPLL